MSTSTQYSKASGPTMTGTSDGPQETKPSGLGPAARRWWPVLAAGALTLAIALALFLPHGDQSRGSPTPLSALATRKPAVPTTTLPPVSSPAQAALLTPISTSTPTPLPLPPTPFPYPELRF